jgi:hypothetical protein
MTVRLNIDLPHGKLEIEGEAEFVREIYKDFRDNLMSAPPVTPSQPTSVEDASETKKRKNVSKKRVKPSSDTAANGLDPDHPRMDKQLAVAELAGFYGQFEPKNNAEKLLIFAEYLTNEIGIEKPNTDQYYTCFVVLKERIPKAFAQTFRDASGKSYGYIDFDSSGFATLTSVGINHFNSGLKRKGADA